MQGNARGLWYELAKGDGPALAVLFMKHGADVKRYVFENLKCDDDTADDLALRAFEALYFTARDQPDFHEGYEDIDTMLLMMISAVVIDYIREERKQAKLKGELERVPRVRTRPPDHLLLGKELEQVIRSAVDDLPELYREVAHLVLLQQHTILEASVLTRSTPHTVKTRLWRARRLLTKPLRHYLKGKRK